jgi:hypothetical protein
MYFNTIKLKKGRMILTTSWPGKRKTLVIALVAMLVCSTISVVCAAPEGKDIKWNTLWTTGYMNVHFWYDGDGKPWNNETLWAYGLYVFNIYDWSYLFGWYGLGWDKLSPLIKSPSGKIDLYFYNDPSGTSPAGTTLGKLEIVCNLSAMGVLDTKTNKWATQVLNYGNALSHESSHNIFQNSVGKMYVGDQAWLTESLASYTSSCLWAWGKGDWDTGGWGPKYSKAEVRYNYQNFVKDPASGGLLTWYDCGYTYQHHSNILAYDQNVIWTFIAAGYFLSDLGARDWGSITPPVPVEVKNLGNILMGLRNGLSLSDTFQLFVGRTLSVTTNDITNTGDFYYWFYQYWWS